MRKLKIIFISLVGIAVMSTGSAYAYLSVNTTASISKTSDGYVKAYSGHFASGVSASQVSQIVTHATLYAYTTKMDAVGGSASGTLSVFPTRTAKAVWTPAAWKNVAYGHTKLTNGTVRSDWTTRYL